VVKRLELKNATRTLADYAREVGSESVLITSRGKAIAALVPVNGGDEETVSLGLNPKFLAIIERSREQFRQGKGIPAAEVRRRLGLPEASKGAKRKNERNGKRARRAS
jgi:antitoxin (DNA-binding transcriptional repressor) of toxin-antitoxin stability system